MGAGTYNFTIEQGATFKRIMTWKDSNGNPISLVGYKGRMQIRQAKDSSNVIMTLDTEDNGGMALGGVEGTITIEISASRTAGLDFRTAVYDLELEKDGEVVRLLEGTVTLSKEVTR